MKTIALIRHAKSSWKDNTLPDLDRPLNRRGRVNAPEMGRRLQEQPVSLKRVFSSPAVRATETAEWLMPSLGLGAANLEVVPALYTFNYEDILTWLRSLDRSADRFILICHNPAMTDMVNFLTLMQIDKIPTCGVALLQIDINYWQDLGAGMAELSYFDFPKSVSGKTISLGVD
ncbi:MAG: histidine phosphatase family protein [Gammaproteobacteria bacterium]|nr:MAG: histidine phosphatase family protein [Gammaproteobacteria bacterium]